MTEGSVLDVKLDAFEGPLDLLLHLIKKHEVDIFDIPIHFITERFLDAIAGLDRLDLEVGGEFLVMAATLAQIKSKLLLPRPEPEEDHALDDDPRAELVAQLVEYQRYKELAAQLNDRDLLGREVFARPGPEVPAAAPLRLAAGSLDLFQLIDAFERIKRRAGFRRRLEVTVARRSLADEMARVAATLRRQGRASFWALVDRDESGEWAVVSVVGVFLALLEMARRGFIDVFANPNDPGDLVVEPRTELGDLDVTKERPLEEE
jgi:segregation and condensation protein A